MTTFDQLQPDCHEGPLAAITPDAAHVELTQLVVQR